MEELAKFYAIYGKNMGFGAYKRSSQKSNDDETTKYVTYECNRAQKSVSKSKNSLNSRPTTKTDCGARVSAIFGVDKKWHVSKVVLEHNHHFSPSKGRFYRCYRVVNPRVKRQIEIHQRAGVRIGNSGPMYTPQTCASNKDNVKIRNPPVVRRKGRPPTNRLKSKSEKILTSTQKKTR